MQYSQRRVHAPSVLPYVQPSQEITELLPQLQPGWRVRLAYAAAHRALTGWMDTNA
jgi:hypothetical protein